MKKNRKSSRQSAVGSRQKNIFTVRLTAYCLLLAALCLTGCKTPAKVRTIDAREAKEQTAFFESMQKQAFQYNTFSARTNVDIEMPGNELSSRVDIKIVRDSALQLSIQPFLGIEVFRIEFNTDSVKVIDRMNKQYVLESYSDLKGQTPVALNYYNLQSLFTNRIFIPGEKTVSSSQYDRFELKQEGSRAEAQVTDAMKLLYKFIADGEEKLLSTHVTDKSKQYAIQWLYTDFRLVEKQPFPMLMDIQLTNEGGKMGGLKISFSRIQTEIPVNITNPIPDKYKRITFAQIIKGLSSSKK